MWLALKTTFSSYKIFWIPVRSCFEMVPDFYHAEFSRQFRLRKRERSSGYVTDDEDENGRKGRVIKERN